MLPAQFPELAPVRAEWFGSGCCNEVYRVNGDWLFRFPKRADGAATVEREARLLALVPDLASVSVPRIEWLGRPGPDFPYPFVGYRLIPGTAGATLPEVLPPDDERRIAGQIGRALAAMHRVPLEHAKSLGAVERPWDTAGLLEKAGYNAPLLLDVVPPKLLGDYNALLEGAVAPPPLAPSCVFAHGDLHADHLLFDPATLDLRGFVDFAEIGLHDPAVDFGALFYWRGEAFVRLVLDAYGADGDPWLLDRARFDAVVNAGIWLGEVVWNRDEAGVAARADTFEHIIGPTLRSMVRGGRG
jgi:aminoglycoside phosphotransferase (APT) family kinase protein